MIASLRGIIEKTRPGEVLVDVRGIGYLVSVPLPVWEKVQNAKEQTIWTYTYVREDRLDLFGFLDRGGRQLFLELISKPGIGPKVALEICGVSPDLLMQAIAQQDAGLLTDIKGIGKKKAEQVLIDLKGLVENHPHLLDVQAGTGTKDTRYDQDAIAALSSLGYDNGTILKVLKDLPEDLGTTEERVAAALRSL